MKLDELKKLEKQMEERHKKELSQLAIDFALSNQKFKIGQVVDSGVNKIKIDKVKVSGWSFGAPPCCVYYGVCYTKSNRPFKNGERAGVRESENLTAVEL